MSVRMLYKWSSPPIQEFNRAGEWWVGIVRVGLLMEERKRERQVRRLHAGSRLNRHGELRWSATLPFLAGELRSHWHVRMDGYSPGQADFTVCMWSGVLVPCVRVTWGELPEGRMVLVTCAALVAGQHPLPLHCP
ncbi:hypothetical protein QQG55_44545 [Brugia pahangi]